ncbi:hypothetical protein NADFUDRAFT_84443 [Nadsonia fulvescens var. elongata DSM 6958]|uniref:Uncharacterized protein n=1 Tax=Nadsonia fulvescens var. elongata DSM 6958 TaxID=857566 RepID=A0A1E3PD13_9ASCO|nr:hypothetical protein NADFUDRAFT_84443 [Nadsonia fulvescens var. elongata DSM 6958]
MHWYLTMFSISYLFPIYYHSNIIQLIIIILKRMLGTKFSFHCGLLIGSLWISDTCLAFQPVISKNTFEGYQSQVYLEVSPKFLIYGVDLGVSVFNNTVY